MDEEAAIEEQLRRSVRPDTENVPKHVLHCLERIAIRGGSAGLPRHADRDRRATPFIPACATVNSMCEPQFGLSDLFEWPFPIASAATAQSVSRPTATATYSNRSLISFWRSSPAGGPHRYLRTENDRMAEVKRRVS